MTIQNLHPINTRVKIKNAEYNIVGYGRTRYKIENDAGARYTYPFAGPMTVVQEAADNKTAPARPAPAARIQNFPTLVEGQAVVLNGRGAGRYAGVEGFVAKVNPSTYMVCIPGQPSIKASHALVHAREAVTA